MKFYIDTEKKEIHFYQDMKYSDLTEFFNGWGNDLKSYKIVFNNTINNSQYIYPFYPVYSPQMYSATEYTTVNSSKP